MGSRICQPGPGLGSQPPHQRASAPACPVKPESFMELHYFKPMVSYFRPCVGQALCGFALLTQGHPAAWRHHHETLPWSSPAQHPGKQHPVPTGSLSARVCSALPYLQGSPSGTVFLPDAHCSTMESHGLSAAGLPWCSAPSPSARRRGSGGCRGGRRYRAVAVLGKRIRVFQSSQRKR